MSYFLKKTKTNRKKGEYLQVYLSYYDPETRNTRHKSVESIGYVCDLIESGIEDPYAYGQQIVEKYREAEREEKEKLKNEGKSQKRVTKKSPEKYVGYYLLKAVMAALNPSAEIDILASQRKFQFDPYDCLQALIYARAVKPCSKKRTMERVFPHLFDEYNFSYDDILNCLDFFGRHYKKIVELFTQKTNKEFGIATNYTYFDCTNFYFEIDQPREDKQKGPSKENRVDPIIGMGLLLDENCIPITMRLYPGNQSEKPVLRESIQAAKQQMNITGKTIQVADKGLNCGINIYKAVNRGDGYLFSKSVKTLKDIEKKWIDVDEGWHDVIGKKGNVKYRYKECIDNFSYTFNIENANGEKIKKKISVKEKRILTFSPKLAKKQRAEIDKQVHKAEELCRYRALKSEFGECAKYVTFSSTDDEGKATENKVATAVNIEKIEKDKKLAGYNLLVTSETFLSATKIYDIYHNLWRIEETFRTFKSQLDARPVYLQTREKIYGHFLVCYLCVLLERIVQFKILKGKYGTEKVMDYIRNFKVVAVSDKKYINLAEESEIGNDIATRYNLPVENLNLTHKQIEKVLKIKF